MILLWLASKITCCNDQKNILMVFFFQFLVDTVSNDVEKHGNSHCRNLLMEALTYYLLPERRLQLQCFRTRPRPSTLDNIYILGGADPSNRGNSTWEGKMKNCQSWYGCLSTEVYFTSKGFQWGSNKIDFSILFSFSV